MLLTQSGHRRPKLQHAICAACMCGANRNVCFGPIADMRRNLFGRTTLRPSIVRSGKDGVMRSALNRREFNGLCGALCSFVASSGALVLDAATAVALNDTSHTVKFRDATVVPAVGQGSARIGQGRHPAAEEEEALRTGLSLGMA